MRIILIALFTACLTLSGISNVNAAMAPNNTQASTTSTSATSGNKWAQIKTAVSTHTNQLTSQVTSSGFWSQVGSTIKSYWQKTVVTVKGLVSSGNS